MISPGLQKVLGLYKLYKFSLSEDYKGSGMNTFRYIHTNGSYYFNSSDEILKKYKKIVRSLKYAKSHV